MSFGFLDFLAFFVFLLVWLWVHFFGFALIRTYERRFGFRLNQLSVHIVIFVVAVVCISFLQWNTVLMGTVLAVTPLLVLGAVVDLFCQRLPLILTAMVSMIVALGIIAAAISEHSFMLLIRCFGFGLLAFIIMLAVFVVRLGVGFGDVFIFPAITALCAIAGANAVLYQLIFTALIGGLWALFAVIFESGKKGPTGKTVIPYGPTIVSGGYAALALFSYL